MRRFSRPVQGYILAVMAGGMVVLVGVRPWQLEATDPLLLVTLTAAGILAGIFRLPMAERHLRISLHGAVLLMAVFLSTTPAACFVAAVTSAVSGIGLKLRPWNIPFSSSSSVLSVALASSLYRAMADPSLLPFDSWENATALLVSAAAYWLVSSAMVTVLVADTNHQPFLRTYAVNWREVYLQCILLTLLGVLGAAAWRQGSTYAFLLVVPAVAVYQLLTITRFKQEQVIHAIEIIAEVLDRKNPFTFQHSQRVAEHTVKLAKSLGLRDGAVGALRRAALIHDIGKLGLDDPAGEIPATRGELSDYQFYSLKQHAHLGAMIAREIPAFEEAEEPIRYHHDWYDGSHVSGEHAREEIPLGARIIAVADAYDLLCMANGEASLTYDPKAVEQLRTMSGRQLDPELLDRFLELLESHQAAKLQPGGQMAT
ncbi:MAG: HD-GYP domain-containing protein [Sphingomonadaceae bacterium]